MNLESFIDNFLNLLITTGIFLLLWGCILGIIAFIVFLITWGFEIPFKFRYVIGTLGILFLVRSFRGSEK